MRTELLYTCKPCNTFEQRNLPRSFLANTLAVLIAFLLRISLLFLLGGGWWPAGVSLKLIYDKIYYSCGLPYAYARPSNFPRRIQMAAVYPTYPRIGRSASVEIKCPRTWSRFPVKVIDSSNRLFMRDTARLFSRLKPGSAFERNVFSPIVYPSLPFPFASHAYLIGSCGLLQYSGLHHKPSIVRPEKSHSTFGIFHKA